VGRVERVAQQVQLLPVEGDAQLHPRHDLHAPRPARRPRLGHAGDGVVVGNGEGGQVARRRLADQRRRREPAVGARRVRVQISAAHEALVRIACCVSNGLDCQAQAA
jgi:hypothetical protein